MIDVSKEVLESVEHKYALEMDKILMTGKPVCLEDEVCIRASIAFETLGGWIGDWE